MKKIEDFATFASLAKAVAEAANKTESAETESFSFAVQAKRLPLFSSKNILIMITFMLFLSPNAYALCDGCVVGAVQNASIAITAAIKTAVASLFNILNEMDTNLSNVGSKISESVIQASNREREIAIEAQRQAKQDRIARETALPIDACAMSSSHYVVQAQQSAEATAAYYRRGNGNNGNNGNGNSHTSVSVSHPILDKALNYPIPSVEASRRMTTAIHQTKYCNATEAKLGYTGCLPSTMPDGDANAASLFTGAGLPGKRADLTFTKDQQEAARAYVRLSLDPQPPEHISRNEANTEAGKLYIAMQKAYQANISAAEKAMFDEIASHMPFPSSTALINEIRESDAAARYFNATASAVAKRNHTMSLAELEAFEAGRRWRNPYWVISMGALADPVQLAREQLFAIAFMTDIQYQHLEKSKHIEVLLGQILAALTRANDRSQIEAQLTRVHATQP